MLGPNDNIVEIEEISYETSSAGVLDEPSGFGLHATTEERPGIIGSDVDEDGIETDDAGKTDEPSVSGALSELHDAVSHKIQSWNPYFTKGSPRPKDKGKGIHGKAHNLTDLVKTAAHNITALLGGESIKDGQSEDERLGARVRIGKCTVLFSGNDFWERCIRTHERHDKANGYRLHILRQQLIDDVWSKPAYILSLLLREMSKPKSERLDWLFWVDADTVILNPNIPIETFLPPQGTEFDDVYLMYSMDWNGLNNGVFPIRVNEWAVELFSGIVAYRHFKPEDPLVFRDQSAMNTLMNEPQNVKHIVQAPQRWFNAYQGEHNETLQAFQVRRGDLLVHFAGIPEREQVMHYWLQRAEQRLDDWEVPVKSTSYPQEARDFWTEEREKRKRRHQKVEETQLRASDLVTQIDLRMVDYGDRLNEEDRAKIVEANEKLRKLKEEEETKDDVEKLEEGIKVLTEAGQSLTAAQSDDDKLLLKSAHEAIFAGEKDLIESGFQNGISSPEAEAVSTGIKVLKALIMASQDSWSRHDITIATNGLTDERSKLQAKQAAELQAKKQVEANAKALQEAKLAAQLEADKFSSGEEAADLEDDLGDDSDHADSMETQTEPPLEPELEPELKLELESAESALENTPPAMKAAQPDLNNLPDNVVVVGVTQTVDGPLVFITAYSLPDTVPDSHY